MALDGSAVAAGTVSFGVVVVWTKVVVFSAEVVEVLVMLSEGSDLSVLFRQPVSSINAVNSRAAVLVKILFTVFPFVFIKRFF